MAWACRWRGEPRARFLSLTVAVADRRAPLPTPPGGVPQSLAPWPVGSEPVARRRGRSSARSRRTWPQRALIGLNALAVLAASVTAASLAYSNDRVSDLTRTVIPGGVLRDGSEDPTEAQNFLIVGVDDPSRLAEGDSVKVRETEGKLTDTIMVLRLDPEEGTADLLSLPRDLYVPLSGSGASGRINSAFNVGGPIRLIQTIKEDFGIPVDHYIEIDFAGFRELVGVIDGVPVQFPHPVRSRLSVELEIPEAGCWILGPRQALGFARARKDYQVQDAFGTWHTDLGGDFSRVERQQLFVQLALRRAIAKGARNPNTLRRLVELGARSVTIDDELEPELVVELGRAFRGFDPADLVSHTLPVDEAEQDGPAYLYLREDEAEATLALFRGDQSDASLPAGQVVVRVRNGTGTPEQAGQVTQELAGLGFETLVPDTDVAVGFPTVLVYGAGNEAAALTVARSVNGPVTYQATEAVEDDMVVLITGTDWLGLSPELRPVDDVAEPPTTVPPTVPPGAPDPTADLTNEDAAATAAPTDEAPGDGDDPDDPAFYRAAEVPPGTECRLTP